MDTEGRRAAENATKNAFPHVHGGQMPDTGLFSYRLKRGRVTWMAIIHPTNRVAYRIGNKYGVDIT